MHTGRRERMRARFKSEGLENFADHEVLEMLLYAVQTRGDTNALAHTLLESFGSLRGVLEAPMENLQQVDGVGTQASLLMSLLVPMFRRYQKAVAMERPFLFRQNLVNQYCLGLLSGLRDEYLYLLSISANGKLNGQQLLAKGNPSEVWAYPRRVVEAALNHNAQHVILCHNHPAGDATPSRQDIEATLMLYEALKTMEIQLQDHVIVGDGETYSMAQQGHLPDK